MAEISITAVFSDPNAASWAAETLAIAHGGGAASPVSVRSGGDLAGSAGLSCLMRAGTSCGPVQDRSGRNVLHVRCSPEAENRMVGELAALGAEKIQVEGR